MGKLRSPTGWRATSREERWDGAMVDHHHAKLRVGLIAWFIRGAIAATRCADRLQV